MTTFHAKYCAHCPRAPQCITLVRRTFRKRMGAMTPVVYRYYETLIEGLPSQVAVLDFGAGSDPQYAPRYSIEAYDIDAFGNPLHYLGSMIQEFDIVLGSNVLNVAPNECWLERTLNDIAMALKPSGYAVVNFTLDPRPLQQAWGETSRGSVRKLESFFLSRFFGEVQYVPGFGKKSSPLYILKCPISSPSGKAPLTPRAAPTNRISRLRESGNKI